MGTHTLESMLVCTKPKQEKKPRPADLQSPKCPRCDSTNTKFCYYNNYSLSQPRYFCKSCRRYWTKGGTLRNVPVGGGCRKTKRSSSSSKRGHDQTITIPSLDPLSYDSNDLNLSIVRLQKQYSTHLELDDNEYSIWASPNMAHYGDVLGNFGVHCSSSGVFAAIRAGFLETPNSGIQNLYCGMENGGTGMSESQEMGILFEDIGGRATTASTAVTTMKQETIGRREGDSRVLWRFPWQNIGRDGSAAADFDSGRVNCNGFGSSNWHGPLYSPLT